MRARLTTALSVLGFLAAAAWPSANFVNLNYSQLNAGAYGRIDDVLAVTFALGALGTLLASAGALFRRRWGSRVLTLLAVFILLLFTSSSMTSWLGPISSFVGLANFPAFPAIAAIFLLLCAAWVLSSYEPFRVLVALASIVAFSLPASMLTAQYLATMSPSTISERKLVSTLPGAASMSGESVYYIIVDGYPDETMLAAHGFDNSEFLKDMTSAGFSYDPHARSNYVMTYLSLTAILEADYPVTEVSPPYKDRTQFFPIALDAGAEPFAVRQFINNGYSTFRISNWWGGCRDAVFDICFENEEAPITYALDTYLQPTLLSRVISREAVLGVSDDRPSDALELLIANLDVISSKERSFTFVHHLSPHEPYTRLADCSKRQASPDDSKLTRSEKARLYLDAVSCVNIQITRVVEKIIEEDDDAIIVVQSDHGSDLEVDWHAPIDKWDEAAEVERSGILNLVRVPEDCRQWIQAGLGQINTMRLVLGCLQRRVPQFLPERTFITAYETNPDFGLAVKAEFGDR